MSTRLTTAGLALLAIATAQAADPPPPPPGFAAPGRLIEAAPAADWRDVDPARLLVMTLPQGQVLIELAPQFAPDHVANIQTLARSRYWDGLSVIRAQDGYVVQWGDPAGDLPGEVSKPLGDAKAALPAEFTRAARDVAFSPLPDRDAWAAEVGFVDGFAAAREDGLVWPVHCYGTVGAGRDMAADSSTGAQLYAVIGHAPRALDRNITVVGRVLQGMEWLSTIRRGPPPMGFYTDMGHRTPLLRVALASMLPAAERPRLQVLRTDSATFAALTQMRRERKDGWTVRSPGRVDVCALTVPVRDAP